MSLVGDRVLKINYSVDELDQLNSVFVENRLPKFSLPKKTVTYSVGDDLGKLSTDYPITNQWFMVRDDMQHSKMFYVIQTFETDEGRRFRVGYYIVGTIGKVKGRWTWGQFCPWYREKDLTNLLNFLRTLV